MAFVLNSIITLGKFTFRGVNSVEIRKSIFDIKETATIKIPAIARLSSKSNPTNISIVDIATKITPGDPVQIELGYNGKLTQEFKGFVKSVVNSIPLTIECEGYSWQLAQNKITKFWAKTTLKEVLQEATKGTDVTFQLATDLPLENIAVRDGNGARLIEHIKSKITAGLLTAYFIEPTVLYVGLLYTAIRNDVKYDLGFNTINDDFKERDTEQTKVVIIHRQASGKRIKATTNFGSKEHKIRLQSVSDSKTLKTLAEYAAKRYNHDMVEGEITAFLRPFAAPGDKIIVSSKKSKSKAGEYICQSTKVTFSNKGARRVVGFGAKVGWDDNGITAVVSETHNQIA